MGKYVGQEYTCDYADKGKFYRGLCEKIVLHPHLGTPAAKCRDPELGVFFVALGMDAMEEYEEQPKPVEEKKEPIKHYYVPRDFAGGKAMSRDGKSIEGEIREDNVF